MNIKKLLKKTSSRTSEITSIKSNKNSVQHTAKIAFIIVGKDKSLIATTITSIRNSENSGHFSEHHIEIYDQENETQAVKPSSTENHNHLNIQYVKVIAAGDILGNKFLTEFYQNVNFNDSDDIILHAYSAERNTFRLDPVLANIKSMKKNEQLTVKEYALPCLDNCIIKSTLLSEHFHNEEHKEFPHNIILALEAFTRSAPQEGYQFLSNAYVGSVTGERFETHIQKLVKSGSELLTLLNSVHLNVKHMQKDEYKLKSMLFLVHQIVLVLLKNKKADETLTSEEKNTAQQLFVNISRAIGHNIIKSFSSPTYNHIHKIGYSKMIKSHVDRDICYLEESDNENGLLKFKIASHSNSYPRCFIDKNEVIPTNAKIKKLTLLELEFSYEVYLWISFEGQEQKISFTNSYQTDLFIAGKRLKTECYGKLVSLLENKNKLKEVIPVKAKALRAIATSIIFRKRFEACWLFVDNDLRADDNAEHFYRYVKNNQPAVNAWFLLNKSSPDWNRLKQEGFRLIEFGSLLHRLALLNAKFLLSSHANPAITNYLPRKHYCDIMKFKFVFLQHGVTKDDQSEWLNSRKIDFLVTAGIPEFNDIANEGRYRYTSKETVLTGFPRYDNLKKTDTDKQILVMPTWRKSLSGELMAKSSKRIKNPNFMTSLFCQQWGGFLQSARLKKMAEKNGYKILFLAHPNLVDYLDELAIPDYIGIEIMENCSIQQVFKASDALITDYSSVAFDVAYMRKPILYFHFDIETFFSEHSYSKGYYDYEHHGFGAIADNISTLQNNLNELLKKNCHLNDFYTQRINQFFPYDDNNNSERLYTTLTEPRVLASSRSFDIINQYIKIQLAGLDLIAAEKSIVELAKSGINILPKHKIELNRIVSEMVFWAKLQNRHVLLAKLITHAEKFDLHINNINNLIHESADINLLANIPDIAVALTEGELIKSVDVQYSIEGYIAHDYVLTETKTACEIVYHSVKNNAYLATTTLEKVRNNALFKQATLLNFLDSINLIKLGNVSEALIHVKKTTLTDIQKDNLLKLMLDYHAPEHIRTLDIKHLYCNELSPRATEAYLLLNNEITPSQLNKFFATGNKNDTLLHEYLNTLFENKKHTQFVKAFENYYINKLNVENVSNRVKYLTSVFLTRGIVDLKTKIDKLYPNDSYISAFDSLFLNRSEVTLDVLYQMIEQSIDKQVYSYSCAEVYKYSLHFYKKNRPGLAKKITTISVMKKHEDYYSDKQNWSKDSDYRTLIDAVKELNNVVHELNRIGS
jgi:CDP-glycerol glycerophosphotransferase (TagB/SpsB family)